MTHINHDLDPVRRPLFDRDTMICLLHDVHWCIVCTTDQFARDAQDRRERRRQLKTERQSFALHELFDLGGEG